jgi:hypothetical protein
MQWQTTHTWDRLIGWALLFLWVSNLPLSAQTSEDILRLISQDEEDGIHEDEIILLDDILSRSTGLTHQSLEDILTLTFLEDEDYDLIRKSLETRELLLLKRPNEVSTVAKVIFRALQRNKGIPHKIRIQQIVSMTDGIRYRWKGKMKTLTQEASVLSIRNRYGLDILGDHSIYIQHKTGNSRWIVGDHQMAFGFGLVSGKPFPERKGWSTVNTGTSVQKGLKGYRSSTGMNRTRGIAVEQKTNYGTIVFSQDLAGENKNEKRNYYRGAWQYNNASTLIGTVIASKTQSIYGSFDYGNISPGGEISFGVGSPSIIFGLNFRIRPFKYIIQYRDIHDKSIGQMGNPMVEWRGSDLSEKGLFQGAYIRTGKTRLMIYADMFQHYTREINGYELGIRTETKIQKHKIVFQVKTEKKDETNDVIYAPLVMPTLRKKDGIKLEHQYDKKTWRTQVKYQFIRTGEIEIHHSHGLDLRFQIYGKYYQLELDWMGAEVDHFDSRVYFWDVNLPGEMLTRMLAHSSHSQGIKVLFDVSNESKLGVKLRFNYSALSFSSPIDIMGGLFIKVAL